MRPSGIAGAEVRYLRIDGIDQSTSVDMVRHEGQIERVDVERANRDG
jgi:hypothetical protein